MDTVLLRRFKNQRKLCIPNNANPNLQQKANELTNENLETLNFNCSTG